MNEWAAGPRGGTVVYLLLFLLLVETAGLALYALAFVVAAGVALGGGIAAGVAFFGAFVVLFGVRGGRGPEADEREGGQDERKRFHIQSSSFVPTMDASGGVESY